jgi:hypothetical protein
MENESKSSVQANCGPQPRSGFMTFFLGFFSGLAAVSLICFVVLLGLMLNNRESVNLGAQAGDEQQAQTEDQGTATPVVTKSDKPVVELFVMSHCPYGTQIEKGLIPVMTLLGDKIDANIRFVYYSMHGEKEVNEELNQYCIQKEQKAKYLAYLTCFLGEGNGADCLTQINVDQKKMNSCVSATDKKFNVLKKFADKNTWLSGKYPLFDVEKDLNEKYGVGGSPTLIINGTEAQVGRDSASLLNAVCAGFNNPPEECATQLSSESPSSGFGFNAATGATGDASCGS